MTTVPEIVFQLIILLISAFGVVRGFRKGFTLQISRVLGFGFGIVCARIFSTDFSQFLLATFSSIRNSSFPEFVSSFLSGIIIYVIVYCIVSRFTGVVKSAVSIFPVGMFNRIAGSFFFLIDSLLWLSIILNLILCINPDSKLIRYAGADDGNIVEIVLSMTSGLLGCPDTGDLVHLLQLREAKKISFNIDNGFSVINKERIYQLIIDNKDA